MRIVLSSDHGGFEYKKELIKFLKEQGFEVLDRGSFEEDVPVSWSEYGLKAAIAISNNEADLGISICKSGIGVCIAANKVKGVYCGLAYNDKIAQLCKTHDGCNMIAFGAEYTTLEEVKRRTMLFINAKFEGGRHLERLNQLKDYEFGK